MMIYPRNKHEAEKYRYGSWVGAPAGQPYNPNKCAAAVWQDMDEAQCSRRNGKGPAGLYCGTHAKMAERTQR